nr:thioesterase family protein [Anaerolineae bacterium]
MAEIGPGVTGTKTIIVTDDLTASHLGSGEIGVFATPAMVALMEGAAVAALSPLLPAGQTSVGVAISTNHLAATPTGHQVRAEAVVTGVDGRKVMFQVKAWDEKELIGEGTHTRFLVDLDRFLERVSSKRR